MKSSATPPSQLEQIAALAGQYCGQGDQLMQVLLNAQKITGNHALVEDVAVVIAEHMGVSVNHIYDFATFYSMFSVDKRGKHIIRICKSTPCHVNGAVTAVKLLSDALNIGVGQTTEDQLFTLEYTECIGVCDQAPAMMIDEKVYGPLNEVKVRDILNTYRDKDGIPLQEDN